MDQRSTLHEGKVTESGRCDLLVPGAFCRCYCDVSIAACAGYVGYRTRPGPSGMHKAESRRVSEHLPPGYPPYVWPGSVMDVTCKKRFFGFFLFWSRFTFLTFLIFQTFFFIFEKRWQSSERQAD